MINMKMPKLLEIFSPRSHDDIWKGVWSMSCDIKTKYQVMSQMKNRRLDNRCKKCSIVQFRYSLAN